MSIWPSRGSANDLSIGALPACEFAPGTSGIAHLRCGIHEAKWQVVCHGRADDYPSTYDARMMRCYPVSRRINHVMSDYDEECSVPVELVETQIRLFSVVGLPLGGDMTA